MSCSSLSGPMRGAITTSMPMLVSGAAASGQQTAKARAVTCTRCTSDFLYGDALDLHLLVGAIVAVPGHVGNRVDHLLAAGHLSEDRVVRGQAVVLVHDEKLRPVSVRPGVRH